mmetsp:Transcript_52561/g.87218  ORF Transcript_52561/g.87218 Transcript_52561/m.87218 type:complete len:218 (+) Transcript_52561:69-722(+)
MSPLTQPLPDAPPGRNKVDAAQRVVQLLLFHPLVVWACQLLVFAVLYSLNDAYWRCPYPGWQKPGSYPSVLQIILSPPPASWNPFVQPGWIANPLLLSTCQAAFTLLCSLLVWFCAVKRSGCCCPACIVVFACLYFVGATNPLLTAPILVATSKECPTPDWFDDQVWAAWAPIRSNQLMTLGTTGTIPSVIEAIYAVYVGVALLKYRRDLGGVQAMV